MPVMRVFGSLVTDVIAWHDLNLLRQTTMLFAGLPLLLAGRSSTMRWVAALDS
jgi:hypothetical protein